MYRPRPHALRDDSATFELLRGRVHWSSLEANSGNLAGPCWYCQAVSIMLLWLRVDVAAAVVLYINPRIFPCRFGHITKTQDTTEEYK